MQKAEELLREGKLDEALAALQDQVRSEPAKPELRMFLFQLLSILGNWERAMTQLNVAAEMDADKMLVAAICRPALQSEAFRSAVFDGQKLPLVFGEPEEWVGWLIQANQLVAQGELKAAAELRDKAFDAAPALSGTINGKPFEWIADMDSRLGPILEAVVDQKYFWIPFTRIKAIRIEKPVALRNMVWAEAQFTWANGGTAPGLIPTRYPGSEKAADTMLRLARGTHWDEREGGYFLGLGQRMLATDAGELSLLEIRNIVLANDASAGPGQEGQAPPQAEPSDG
jgi:type VI secretion system protein ImpE